MDGRHQVGERLAGSRSGLNQQPTAAAVELGDRQCHLKLGLAELVIVEPICHRTIRAEERPDRERIGRGRRIARQLGRGGRRGRQAIDATGAGGVCLE